MHAIYTVRLHYFVRLIVSATRHWNFQRLFITTMRHCSTLEINQSTESTDGNDVL